MSNLVLVLARNPRLMFSFSFSEENNLVLKVFWFFGQRVDTLFMILEKKRKLSATQGDNAQEARKRTRESFFSP